MNESSEGQSRYAGVLGFILSEAIWLVESDPRTFQDVLVAYPSTDRQAITRISQDETLASCITLMVDSLEHLDFILGAQSGEHQVRVCIDMDMSYRSKIFGHIGVKRSALYIPAEVRSFAEKIVQRPDLKLVGLMGYEAQIAGVGNDPAGLDFFAGLETRLVSKIQESSKRELSLRRAEAVALVREIAELEFVNGGGTGSIESTVADNSVTEVAAGSGLYGSHLFDHYTNFSPAPAAAFAVPVVRKPESDIATVFGGGWIASGPAGESRLPQIAWPEGLAFLPREGAGEVQTPVKGAAVKKLELGDWLWLRHTKAGELAEHCNTFALVQGDELLGEVQSYRGEGKVFV